MFLEIAAFSISIWLLCRELNACQCGDIDQDQPASVSEAPEHECRFRPRWREDVPTNLEESYIASAYDTDNQKRAERIWKLLNENFGEMDIKISFESDLHISEKSDQGGST
jgi:hypothetical protein